MKTIHIIALSLILGIFSAAKAQTVSITFRVNMGYQIELGQFDPATEFVDIAGTFNGWGSTPLIKLFDPDGDNIYEILVSGFTPGSSIEYKYRYNGTWDGVREEFPGAGNNRLYTVLPDANIVYVWFNNEVSPTGSPVADFTASSQSLFENGMVYFENLSAGAIDTWEWTFEGGSPAVSDKKEPVVIYPTMGAFDVTLVVSNATESDTLTMSDYIQVQSRNTSEISWWNNTVFYELFVRSFYDSDGDGIGDFKGAIQKLDYLNDGDPNTDTDLGITGIWLMPISQSPSYHGYDVTDYRSIESDYGTMNDFKDFLAAAHARGIRVIIDFVMNHSSDQHPWFQNSVQNVNHYYGLFWGGMPDLNYENPAVKDSMFAAADYWLNNVGVDGFRLDAVKYIIEENNQLEDTEATFQFWGEFNQHIKQTRPDAFTVGEAWTNTTTILKYVTQDRLDYCFEFDLASATLNAVNSGNADGLAAQMQKVYNLYPHHQYGTFLTNHDQTRVMNIFESDISKAKTAAALYLTFPGVPYLYYGEEIGMAGDKPDEYIRTPMQWSTSAHAGFTTGSPWLGVNSNYSTRNVATAEADSASLLNWYKQLISIRNQEPALRLGDYSSIISSESSIMAFLRHLEDETIMVIVNTSAENFQGLTLSTLGGMIPSGSYTLLNLLDDQDSLLVTVNSMGEIENLSVNGHEALIYSFSKGALTEIEAGMSNIADFQLHQNYPNPFNSNTQISYSLANTGNVSLKIYDVRGREWVTLIDKVQETGHYEIAFDADNMATGVYFYRLAIGNSEIRTRKMVLIR